MYRWSAATVILVGIAGSVLLAVPAGAGTPGVVVRVTPSQGIQTGQTLTVTGRGLQVASGGSSRTWFITECTAAVRGRMNPSTDTPHCDITHAQPLHVARNGTFTAHYRVVAGIIGDGYCGTIGHATCVIGVGTAEGVGTVVRITFKTPTPTPTTPTTMG
jgi:hypothetical protein